MIISGLTPLIHEAGAVIILTASLTCCLIAQSHRPVRFYAQGVFHLLSFLTARFKNISINIFNTLRNKSVELPPVAFNQEHKEEMNFDETDVSMLNKEQEEPLTISQPASGQWKKPHYSLMPATPKNTFRISNQEIRQQTQKLQDKLAQFSITGEMVGVKSGPSSNFI